MQEKLSDAFYRCHNSHIVNLNYVTSLASKEGFFVELKDGSRVEVSRRNKENLLLKLSRLSK
ncbi:MAG: LytTR family transcriptional regulator [Bacteroidota bacterium]|jgi:two-component system LytT family response regulator|nr:LytTR family transcriptional regulator [Bacteroidota bacterium]